MKYKLTELAQKTHKKADSDFVPQRALFRLIYQSLISEKLCPLRY